MNKNNRLHQIESALNLHGSVDVYSLSKTLGTSEMTIRRDLSILASQGKAIRIHGGAILPTDRYINGNGVDSRALLHTAEKRAIAREAAKYIHSGDTVFLDDSSTVSTVTEFIPLNQQLIITTSSIRTALKFNSFPNTDVVCLGGKVCKTTQSVTGPLTTNILKSMFFKTAFIGIPSISDDGIITTSSFDELSIKKTIIKQSSQTILLIDSSKIHAPLHMQLADASEISLIITDPYAPESFISNCKERNISLVLAPM